MSEPTHLYRKPKNPEACIRDPRSRSKLPAYGGRVPNNRYWRARTSDGDIVETTAEEIGAAKARAAEAAKSKATESDDVKVPETENSNPASKAKRGR